MMDLFVLAVVAPLVIVAIVFLLGFAGCGDVLPSPADPSPPSAPTGLTATAVSATQVTLSWTDNSGGAAQFVIARAKTGGVMTEIKAGHTTTTFDDTGLTEGTTFTYEVRAATPPVTVTSVKSDAASAAVTTLPDTPTDVKAEPVADDTIVVSWQTTSTQALIAVVQHHVYGTTPAPLTPPVTNSSYTHTGLQEGSTHEYAVQMEMQGIKNGAMTAIASKPSPWVTATTGRYEVAFNGTLTTNESLPGRCLIQRIPAALITKKGTRLRLTLKGSTAAGLAIDQLSVSNAVPLPAPAGVHRWDADGPVTVVLPSGTSVPANGAVTIPAVEFTFDGTRDLLMAMNLNGSAGNVAHAARASCEAYVKANTAEAGVTPRSDGYTTIANRLYVIAMIEIV